jgi:hypothetical protein
MEFTGPPYTGITGRQLDPAATIVNVAALDVTPPGFTTVTVDAPAEAICAAGTDAVTCVALTYVVVKDVPFHWTVEPDTKPEPFTVSVKAAPPAVAVLGLRLVIAGPALIVNVAPADVTPPLVTAMVAVPAEAIKLAGTDAVTWVPLT